MYRNNPPNIIIFYPKLPCFNPSPSGSQLVLPVHPCPWGRLQHLEQIPQLQKSNIPQGKKPPELPPAGPGSLQHPENKFLKLLQSLKPPKPAPSPGQGCAQGTNTSPAPLQSISKHTPPRHQAVKGATATQPPLCWGNKNQYSFQNLREQRGWKGCHGIYG